MFAVTKFSLKNRILLVAIPLYWFQLSKTPLCYEPERAADMLNPDVVNRPVTPELRSIDDTDDELEFELVKTPDEGEEEAEWLKRTGFDMIACEFESGREVGDEVVREVTQRLTMTQASAVRRRVETLNSTLRKKRGGRHASAKTDVRNVFASENGASTADRLRETVMFDSATSAMEDDHSLPDLKLPAEPAGLTQISDLSPNDLKALQKLALIELTALFDHYRIVQTKKKIKLSKSKDVGLFGVPLQALLENDHRFCPRLEVPLIFQEMVRELRHRGLRTEGILRVSGSAARIKALRSDIETRYPNLNFSPVPVHDLAAILKWFLRELPQPLLTLEHLFSFSNADHIPSLQEKLKALNLLILLLPDVHRNTLEMLLSFLSAIVHYESVNKMSLTNVATIIAPNLFIPKQAGHGKHSVIEFCQNAVSVNVVRLLIRYHELLWTVPSFLVQQVRDYNDSIQSKRSQNKQMFWFIHGRKEKPRPELYRKKDEDIDSDLVEGIIRVQAPSLSKVILLKDDMTAEDIVRKFGCFVSKEMIVHRSQPSRSRSDSEAAMELSYSPDDYYLYEVGGNVGWRRLPHSVRVINVHRLNPNADWLISTKEHPPPP